MTPYFQHHQDRVTGLSKEESRDLVNDYWKPDDAADLHCNVQVLADGFEPEWDEE